MLYHKYIAHQASDISYLCILKKANADAHYISDKDARGNVEKDVQTELSLESPARIDITASNIENEYNSEGQLLKSTLTADFVYGTDKSGRGYWNVIAIMNQNNNALAIAYELSFINTIYVKDIRFIYTIEYNLTGEVLHTGVEQYFLTHVEEETVTDHSFPKYLGTIPGNLSHKEVSVSVESPKQSDLWCEKESTPKYQNKRCYISMSNTGPIVIYNKSGAEWRVTPYNRVGDHAVFDIPFTMPEEVETIRSLNAIDDFQGIVLDSREGKYVWTLVGESEYSDPVKVEESDDYDILIPTFIDLCHCYVKIPNLDRHAPYYFELCYWKSLLNESAGYVNDMTIPVHTNGSDPDSDYFVEPFSSSLEGSYMTSSNARRVSPISALADMMLASPRARLSESAKEGSYDDSYEGARNLYLNLRLMASAYADLFGRGKYKLVSVTPCDSGLDITLEDERCFVTYFGKKYKLPSECSISNMFYYTDAGIYDISSRECIYEPEDGSRIYSYKYGVPIIGDRL